MAGNRIRSVRPELVENQSFGSMSDGARALWLQLYPLWDDDGRSLGSVAYVHGRCCFARRKSKAAVARELAELEAGGWIKRYSVAGIEYMFVPGWADTKSPTYQFIKDKRDSKIPAPMSDSRTEPRTGDRTDPRTDARTLEGDLDQDQGRGIGNGGGDGADRRAGRGSGTPTHLPIGWLPDPDSEMNRQAADDARSRGVDVQHQLAQFIDHSAANDVTGFDHDARWRLWLRNGHPRPGRVRGERASSGQQRMRPKIDEEPTFDEGPPALTADEKLAWAAATRDELATYKPPPPPTAAEIADENRGEA